MQFSLHISIIEMYPLRIRSIPHTFIFNLNIPASFDILNIFNKYFSKYLTEALNKDTCFKTKNNDIFIKIYNTKMKLEYFGLYRLNKESFLKLLQADVLDLYAELIKKYGKF